MATHLARCTIAIGLLAAVVEVILACTSSAGLTLEAVGLVVYIVGPFGVLSFLAWRQRTRKVVSYALLFAAIILSLYGLYHFGMDSYRYHTDPNWRLVQRLTVFVVPLFQWGAVVAMALGLFVWNLIQPKREPTYE